MACAKSSNFYRLFENHFFCSCFNTNWNRCCRKQQKNILNNKYFDEYRYKLGKYKNPPVQFKLDIEQENDLIENRNLVGIKNLMYNEVVKLKSIKA